MDAKTSPRPSTARASTGCAITMAGAPPITAGTGYDPAAIRSVSILSGLRPRCQTFVRRPPGAGDRWPHCHSRGCRPAASSANETTGIAGPGASLNAARCRSQPSGAPEKGFIAGPQAPVDPSSLSVLPTNFSVVLAPAHLTARFFPALEVSKPKKRLRCLNPKKDQGQGNLPLVLWHAPTVWLGPSHDRPSSVAQMAINVLGGCRRVYPGARTTHAMTGEPARRSASPGPRGRYWPGGVLSSDELAVAI